MRHHVICALQCTSTGTMTRMRPVKPPIVNTKVNPAAHSTGVSRVIESRHIVATDLKIFTPVGTTISIVAYMNNS